MTMNLSSTVLALQMMNGVKLYSCTFDLETKRYSFKSNEKLEQGDYVLVDTINGPKIAQVVEEDITCRFDQAIEWRWVIQKLENVAVKVARYRQMDDEAKKKIAMAESFGKAKAVADTLGVSVADFKPALPSDVNTKSKQIHSTFPVEREDNPYRPGTEEYAKWDKEWLEDYGQD